VRYVYIYTVHVCTHNTLLFPVVFKLTFSFISIHFISFIYSVFTRFSTAYFIHFVSSHILFYFFAVKLLGILFKDTAVLKMVSELSVKVIEEKTVIDVSFTCNNFHCFSFSLFLRCFIFRVTVFLFCNISASFVFLEFKN
jgi:hypothetical protein